MAERRDLSPQTVLVRVLVQRQVLEEREDVDGERDWYIVKREIVSEREWFEDRAKALPQEATAE